MIQQLRTRLFPLCKRPAGVVVVDDEGIFLESIMDMIQPTLKVDVFIRPSVALAFLKNAIRLANEDNFALQQSVNCDLNETSRIEQILAYWNSAHLKYDYPTVVLADYSMEPFNGLELFSRCPEWAGRRILLTGNADRDIAFNAFNEDLIDMFLEKSAPNIGTVIRQSISAMFDLPDPRRDQILINTFSQADMLYFSNESVVRDLFKIAKDNWIEYVAIGDPFGILGYDEQGQVSWLQLETPLGFASMTELLVENSEVYGQDAIHKVTTEKHIVNVEMARAMGRKLGRPVPIEALPSFAVGDSDLRGALFKAPDQIGPRGNASYEAWLSKTLQTQRSIHH